MSTEVKDQINTNIQKPRKYHVMIHNDDYTPFDFVELLLMEIFRKNKADAYSIAKSVHFQGTGIAGTYTYEIAETKQAVAMQLAEDQGYPLQLTMEPEE